MSRMIPPLLLAAALAVPADATAQSDLADLADLAWLAGCWRGDRTGGWYEEHWMAPAAGTMLGMSRTVRGERTVAHEALMIHAGDDGRLVYAAAPSGQPPAVFTLAALEEGMALFENPSHDFPQRIRYTLVGDSLHARIEGVMDGRERTVRFPMAAVACPAAGGSKPGG